MRERFEEWKSPRLNKILHYSSKRVFLDWPEGHHDCSHLDATFYADEELERYSSMLSEVIPFKQPLVNEWMENLRSGSDEPLKVLIMAMSRELKKVTIVCWNSKYNGPGRSRPFRMLASMLRALAPLSPPQWPYFEHLKKIYVGLCTPITWADNCYHPIRVDAPLFLLPAMEYLHLNGVHDRKEDGNRAICLGMGEGSVDLSEADM